MSEAHLQKIHDDLIQAELSRASTLAVENKQLRDENARLQACLINMQAAWNNKGETTSVYVRNERMKAAMADVNDFQNGYLCALSCIVKGHGCGVAIEEALSALGRIDWSTVDPYDREVLQESMNAVEQKRAQVPQ